MPAGLCFHCLWVRGRGSQPGLHEILSLKKQKKNLVLCA